MAHFFVLSVLPEEIGSAEEKERIESVVDEIMAPYWTGSGSGDYNSRGFFDSFAIGGRFDGAINGIPNYYYEALALSKRNPEKDYGELFRKLATEEVKRNSCVMGAIRFPGGIQTVLPEKVVLPDGSVKEMPSWLMMPDLVRTSTGKVVEMPLPMKPREESEALRRSWDSAWQELVDHYGRQVAVGLDCHI